MYWSHFAPEITRQLISEVGFNIESDRIEVLDGPDNDVERHLWIVARKPA